ncbi:MAG: PIN domain-containing protein [Actinobacteria bacterium]|nr:MAG: PIN domain-containing protein [Actinomycetota bacterium]
MIVVVDTNVIVSGLIDPNGVPGLIVAGIVCRDFVLAYDGRILSEYAEVLRRTRLGIHADAAEAIIDAALRGGIPAPSAPLPARLPHAADEPFLEIALASGAECLITGNLAHFPVDLRQGVRVLSPAEFIEYRRRPRD